MLDSVAKRWTPERELRLSQLWEANAPLNLICEQLETSVYSVIGKARLIGLSRRANFEWPDELIDRLKRLWIEKYSASEIGRALGKSRNAVLGKVHRLGLATRKVAPNAADRLKRSREQIEARKLRLEYKRVWAREERAERRGELPPRERRRPAPMPVWGGSLSLPLLSLKSNQCRFTYSATSPFLFCGQPTLELQSWCFHCAAIVHQPLPQARKPFKQNGWAS